MNSSFESSIYVCVYMYLFIYVYVATFSLMTCSPVPPSGCPHCKTSIPDFTTAADTFKEDRKIAYAAVDCTKEKNQDLCKQEGVEGFPTFNYYNYGKLAEKYNGERGVSSYIQQDPCSDFHGSVPRTYKVGLQQGW
ncbi:hypothetical protein FKM82_021617, partial [Ascaphus truei]